MSKVVFVGNVPYNMSEDALIDVFKSVGQVVGFRLVFDRDTGKPKGYGFCEFADHETAASAVRNLNNTDVGGRPLRIDLADSDPFSRRQDNWSEILAAVPPGKPLPPGERATEAITHAIAQNMTESQLIEVIAQMKAFVITHPKQAQQFLSNHPQVAYAVFMGLITSNIIARDVLNRMLDNANNRSAPPTHLQPPPPPQNFASPPQLHPQAQHPQHQPYPPPPPRLQQPQPVHGMMPPGMGPPPPGAMFGHMQPTPPNMPPMPPYYRGPPQSLPPQQPPHLPPQQPPHLAPQPPPQQSNLQPLLQLLRDGGGNNPDAQALYSIVLSLTPAQINELPAAERETIESLRGMLMANPGVA
ncbi:Protein related to Cleavage stimulation factor [Mycena sanguinolenta]|uniref:Protein related to Cleavage stimulation factor n=1 Tax=Mycena sanguinolenta TaxID=230812 RepID=A0A8H7DCL3_9AGAR|nr:Protein related to Cleavage stimulation factor [Mycena sanguinolenta]